MSFLFFSLLLGETAKKAEDVTMPKAVRILGTGCAKCTKLTDHAEAAAKALGLDCRIEKVTDLREIMAYGVMMTPALVVDGEVKVVGKVPSVDEIKRFLGEARG